MMARDGRSERFTCEGPCGLTKGRTAFGYVFPNADEPGARDPICRLCRNNEQAALEEAKRAANRTRIEEEAGLSFAEIAKRKKEAQDALEQDVREALEASQVMLQDTSPAATSGPATLATPVAAATAGGSVTPGAEPDLEIELAPVTPPTPAGARLSDWLDSYESGAFQVGDLLIVRTGRGLHFWRTDREEAPPGIVPEELADYLAHQILRVSRQEPITGAIYG